MRGLAVSRVGILLEIIAAVVLVGIAGNTWADDAGDADHTTPEDIRIDAWLAAGPVAERLPLFSATESGATSAALLDEPAVPGVDLWPEPGRALAWRAGETLFWSERSAVDGEVALEPAEGKASVALLACYLDSSRRQTVDLVVWSRNVLCVTLDGEEAARKAKVTARTDEEPETTATLDLPTGKSLLLIRTAVSPGDSLDSWRLRAALRIAADRAGKTTRVSLSPQRTFARLDDLSRIVEGGSARISPDGSRFVVQRSRWVPDVDRTETFLEIREAKSGALVQTLDLQASVSSVAWSPDGSRLAMVMAGEDGVSDLWILNLNEGSLEKVLQGKKALTEFVWSGDGEALLFVSTADVENESEESPYERLTEPYMRWPGWKDRHHLWMVSLADRVERLLTEGEFSIGQIASCSQRPLVAFVRTVPIDVRPYEKMELWTLDLQTFEATLEREMRFAVLSDLTVGSRGERIAWVASPSETDTLPESVDHNAYEQDLYVWHRAGGTMLNLTGEFHPSVGADLYGAGRGGPRLWWDPESDFIYFTATAGGKNHLYRADVGKNRITHLPLEPSAVYGISGSGSASRLLLYGSSIDRPPCLFRYDLKRRDLQELLLPGEPVYSQIRFGNTEPWNFINARGQDIEGWIYYPPGFERTRTYPMIVYYYGGVFPNGEAFVWRNHYLAANGYVVYTLNPVGAVGYGPEFADAHVNDWGERAAEDVIEGVQSVLAEHPFIDGESVGAFGGSYGGFLTMQILTKTDLFAAAEASYGISNITSYWGQGRWGYLYGDVALARSFPWNRPDIFVERSPLFHANNIHTPLLLTHGTGDTNVPSGESDQMFTALRVLRKDVVYVRFPGQEHGIVGTQSIRVAHNEIRLEWFDKVLKDQPEAWDARWDE